MLKSSFLRVARQPLARFTLMGLALFVVDWTLRDDPVETERPGATEEYLYRHLTVSRAMADALVARAQERSPEPLDAGDRRAAIDRFVREEVLYREALALGLDRGDLVVRRRLVQKIELLLRTERDVPEPACGPG